MSRTNIEIFLGIIIVLITGGLLVAYGLNEPARMAQAARVRFIGMVTQFSGDLPPGDYPRLCALPELAQLFK